jgi:hypothetical protein
MANVEYHFQRRGATQGQSGTTRSWEPGETKVLPENELDHVPERHYETRPLKPEKTQIEHHGGPYYKIRIQGEIVMDGDEPLTVKGKDAARDKLSELR